MLSEKDEVLSTVETDADAGTYVISTYGLVIGGKSDLDDTPLQQAKNAKVQIGTTTVQRSTNRIENLLLGLTPELKATGEASVSIGDDYSKVRNFFADFVAKYNAVVKQVNEMTDKDKGLFQGDQIITGVKNSLAGMLDPLCKYGTVSYNEDGTLTFNSSAVDELANKDPQKLKRLVETIKNQLQFLLRKVKDRLPIFHKRLSIPDRWLEPRYGKVSKTALTGRAKAKA